MKERIQGLLSKTSALYKQFSDNEGLIEKIAQGGERLSQCIREGGTIYTCGNGGSACEAMHFVEELVARYKRERPGIRAQHFLDPGTVTCWANDYSYEAIFARQVTTFCTSKDILLLLTTSGKSPNLLLAAEAAKQTSTFTIALLGKGGSKLESLVNLGLVILSDEIERIQEIHLFILHFWCEVLDNLYKK